MSETQKKFENEFCIEEKSENEVEKGHKCPKNNKMCRPAITDTQIPDLIKTECISDSRKARHKKTNKKNQEKRFQN